MNMLKPAVIVIALAGAAYAVYSFLDKGGKPGMTEAVFDADDIRKVIDRDTNTTSLRFYAARKEENNAVGTAIMIGTNTGGRDLYTERTSPYVISMGMIANGTETKDLTEEEAKQHLRWINQAGDILFATNFSLRDVNSLLGNKECNGIQLVTKGPDSHGNFTMIAYAVKITAGRATIIAGAPSFTCAQPCPSYCGSDPSPYLNKRL